MTTLELPRYSDTPEGYLRVMRQSTIGTAQTCQYRLTYDLDPNRPYYAGISRAMGTAYHAGLDYLYNEVLLNGKLGSEGTMLFFAEEALNREIAEAGERFDWVYQVETKRKAELILDRDTAWSWVQRLLVNYLKEGYVWPVVNGRYEVLATEYSFMLPFEGRDDWRRQGAIDLIIRDTESGWIHAVDHKTAKAKWPANKSKAHNSPQGAWYTQALWDLILGFGTTWDVPKGITFTYDVHSFEGTFQRIDASRTEEQRTATMEQARRLADLIDQGGPFIPSPDSFLCSKNYCDHWEVCPFGKTLHS